MDGKKKAFFLNKKVTGLSSPPGKKKKKKKKRRRKGRQTTNKPNLLYRTRYCCILAQYIMGKTKFNGVRSRAARRVASPSDHLDISITSIPRAEKAPVQRPSILLERSNAGVSKKQAKEKPKSRAQRLRQKKGIERAEVVLDQMENKVSKSVNKGRTIKARRV